MKFTVTLALLGFASIAVAAVAPAVNEPNEAQSVPAHHLEERQCLPASCQSFGCCSGNCGYWCRACGISYVC